MTISGPAGSGKTPGNDPITFPRETGVYSEPEMLTLKMIRRMRDICNDRAGVGTGIPCLYDIRVGKLLSYLRHRYYRETGHFSPI